jgi:hypothetical protein
MVSPFCRLISSYFKFVAMTVKHNQQVNINVLIASIAKCELNSNMCVRR